MALVQTVRRRRLGEELRRLRLQTGLSAEEVAEQVEGWSSTKISRAENAKVAVREAEVVALLSFYKASENTTAGLIDLVKNASKRGWWQSYTDVISPFYTDLITLETEAETFQTYEASFIPGLFQTAGYAREVIDKLSPQSTTNIEARVEVRIARQSVLTRPNNPLKVWAVIHQSAIEAGFSPSVMAPQLERLIALTRLPTVDIQVMPSSAGVHPGMGGPFTLIGFPQRKDLDVVLIEALLTSLWIEDPAHVDQYRAKFQEITADAMTREKSLAFITAQRDRLTS
ncbi:helix-turn-helix domain-containing protein [Kitasatospora indigofera]|uniref:helix-turn-helix domain-containing protein n=1 Tax=Kitasatospora indigofera TaxID=67307 RepID=UPI0033B77680